MRHETDHALQAEERMPDDLWSSAAGLGRMGHMGQVRPTEHGRKIRHLQHERMRQMRHWHDKQDKLSTLNRATLMALLLCIDTRIAHTA